MTHLLHHSLAHSTRTTYNSAIRSFISFALTYNQLTANGSLLPATIETLMLYATFLSYSLKPQSIKVYLSAIRNLHLQHGHANPMDNTPQLRSLLRGMKRLQGHTIDPRLPITPSLLRRFRSYLRLTYQDHLTLWAAMVVAFFGFLRSSELLALSRSDIIRTEEAYRIRIRQSKTDPFRAGATICLSPVAGDLLCPVAALDQLLASMSYSNGLLFRFQSGSPMTRPKLNHLIQVLSSLSGVHPASYSSHSFRIGATSTAAAAGLPDWKIQALGRWASECYRRYIRLPTSETNSITAILAHTPL